MMIFAQARIDGIIPISKRFIINKLQDEINQLEIDIWLGRGR